MIDRNKIIKGLECYTFILGKRKCNECPYQKDNGCYQLQDDFRTLLKEQKPKVTIITHQNDCCKDGKCPSCGHELDDNMHPKYCGYCGQVVKWE